LAALAKNAAANRPIIAKTAVLGSGTTVYWMVSVGLELPLSRLPKRRIVVAVNSDSLFNSHPKFAAGVFSQPCASDTRLTVELKR
jgi:hypothetical protein